MRWLPSGRGELLAIALALLFLAAAIGGVFVQPQIKANFGFGPDWDCKAQAYEPVCIKRPK